MKIPDFEKWVCIGEDLRDGFDLDCEKREETTEQ